MVSSCETPGYTVYIYICILYTVYIYILINMGTVCLLVALMFGRFVGGLSWVIL